jgi:glycosyltransferase involved in cell wall biosynthesis
MATPTLKELSVFFPAYNEEKNIEPVVTAALRVLENVADQWEIIIVNDGSRDNTGKIADKLANGNKRIKVVHNRPNKGYGGALKSGFEAAKYEWVAFTDADGQFDFADIAKFIKAQKETRADLVLGIRTNRADSALRKLFTFVWSKLLPRLLLGLKVTDYSCGFKLIRKQVYENVQPLIGEEKVTQIEMLVKAQKLNYKFAEVGVGHYPRKHGQQTGADFKVVVKSLQDLFKLWYQLRTVKV